ncbi:hypothetical protein VNI00_016323 [Paramarasmius palmivorus]|uniref:Nitrogen regulatory protein areA GATA-like domain-containing protein n=1 Tax=Paramarasmius palmivorus TaxID=297713 RepID=A0AAW0BE87_9AGAR
MLLDFPSPVLTVAPDALRHLDGDHALESLWYLFTKCKGSLHDGPRLENISWRLWYRELAATNSYRPLTPNSPLSEVTDGPFVLSQGARIVARQPIGQVIYEMLPGSSPNTTHTLNSKFRIPVEKKEAMNNVPPVNVLPTPATELLSISIIPHDAYSSQGVPPQSPHPAVAAPSSIPSISTSNFVSTSSTSAPTINSTQSDNGINPRGGLSFFPRVVVVNPTPNPTPHPTPPATPVPMSVSLHLPVTVSVATTDSASLSSSQKFTGKLLLPPVQLLQPTSTPNSNMANDNSTPNPHSQTDARKFALSPEAPSASEDKRSVPHPQPNPGTGTLSAFHSVATSRTVGLAQSGTSTSQLRSMEPMHIPESLLPLSPDPSSSSVASFHNWTMNVNSTDQNSSRAHTTETASSTAVPSGQASSGNNRISVGGNANKVNASGNTSGSVRGLPTSSDKSSTSPGRDASASSLAPKFFLSSTNASPSPGSGTNGSGDQSQSSFNSYSGSSFGRRSDASHSELMSVSPLDADVSQEPLNQRRQTSHSDAEVAPPTATSSTLSHPYPTAGPSSPSSSSHSRTAKRTTNSHHYPYHTTHNYGHHPQKDFARRGKSKSVSGSRSRSRSRTRLAEGLTMTSAAPSASTSPRAKNTTSTSANDAGGAKPRPRRKGSGDAGLALGAKATGDRGRYTRPYGYGIFQVLNQSQNQPNTGPSTQTQKPSQGAQQQAKRLFRVGNGDDDDEGWEDDDDSSSLSRSLSQSQSRSRSRSSRSRRMSSHSPPVLTSPNGAQQGRGDAIQHVQSEASTNGVSNQQLQVQQPVSRILDDKTQLTASPSSQGQTETQLEPRQTSAATISPNATVSPGTQHLTKAAPTDQIARQQSTKKEGVVGAVVGPNGRKIVVIATDDDDDSDEDDDDWEETEEDDEDVDKKPNSEVPDTSRKSSARTETITAAPKVTEAPRKGSDAAPADSEPTEDDEGWTSASSADDEPSKDPEAGSTIQATVTTAQGALTRGSGTKRLSNGTVTDNRHTNENLHGKDKGKQKAQFQQPLPKGPPRHYPNPPAPQVLQRAHSSKFVGPAGLGFTQQHQLNQPPRNPATRTKEHTQQPQQHPNPNPNPGHGRAPSARQSRRSVDMSEAALEAQRQLDLFAKKPKRAWSGLTRSGSGFLSQLMNPDPEIFPANHPYRRGYSSGDVAMPKGGVTRLGIAPLTPVGGEDGHHQLPGPIEVKKGGISAAAPPGRAVAPPRKGDLHIGTMRPQAPGLKPSKSAVALPVAERVTAASVKDNGLVEGQIRNNQPQRNRAGSGGYRPKARPQDQEMEDTDTEEENRVDMSKSAAQGKLEAILKQRNAAKQKQQPTQPFRQQQDSGRISPRPDMPGRASTDIPPTALLPPAQMQRSRSQHVPGATATPTAPMPLGYPYNLPPAAPPSSPRTTRQLMLRKEMSESLRANLLWSRQLTRAETVGPRRRSSANVSGQWDNQNGNGHDLHNPPAMEPVGENGVAPSNVSQFPTLVQLNPKRRPGRGQMVDAVGVGEPSIQDVGWAGDRPPNARRKSSAAVTGAGRGDTGDGEGIHVGGGANVVTRTRSWGGLAGGTGGMTRMF